MSKYYILISVIVFLLFAIIHKIAKNKKPFRRALLSLSSGPIALLAVNFAGSYFGIALPVSILSILISLAGGISGVTTMLLLNLFF